jgi:sulfopyruvate decarboxylase alpha subunit
MNHTPARSPAWQEAVFKVLKEGGVRQIAYVPDAGHSHAIRSAIADPDIEDVVLTTEEEGVALVSGAWLGGQRAVLLMQSSGVGNCINMLSLVQNCRFPFVALITMRGEWAEFNQWQVPMGRATAASLELMGITVVRAEDGDELVEVVDASLVSAFESDQSTAVLISQRMLGRKVWME